MLMTTDFKNTQLSEELCSSAVTKRNWDQASELYCDCYKAVVRPSSAPEGRYHSPFCRGYLRICMQEQQNVSTFYR